MTEAEPLRPSLVAVMLAVPGAIAVTTPLPLTVATPVLPLLQTIVRPESTLSFASRSTAVAVVVLPTVRVEPPRVTDTLFTGAGDTVSVTTSLLPSLVPVMIALPAASAVTTPLAFTVATVVALLLHVTVRPVSTVPFDERSTALACTVCPTTIDESVSETSTESTGIGETVTVAVPLFPSLVAVITDVPTATAVMTPAPDTVATDGEALLHVTVRPASTPPTESRVTAVACVVVPSTIDDEASVTTTALTGTGDTVTAAVALCPSLVAVMVAVPGATAVTRPLADTVATPVADEVQLTARPVSTSLLAARVTAVPCVVCPTSSAEDANVSDTLATGVGLTVSVASPTMLSTVARITAVPLVSAVTTPAAETVATAGLLLLQATGRPVRTSPL